jgi:hypothetical protein
MARIWAVLLLTAAGLLVPAAPASAGTFVARYELAFADEGDRCVEVTSGAGGTSDGTRLWQWSCNGNLNQLWRAYRVPCGDRSCVIFVNAYSGKCMARALGGLTNGTPLIQWPCSDSNSSEWWFMSEFQPFWFHLWADPNSPHCLQHHNRFAGNGDPVDIWACNDNNPNQVLYAWQK